jgi:malonyl-CoA decarboxylase
VTLSPIPRFREWVEQRGGTLEDAAAAPLHEMFVNRTWSRDGDAAAALRGPMMQLCAHYLLEAKRPSGKAFDPVAHFHLSNGARLERINWLADTSSKGMRESAGMMVNYLYRLDHIDENQTAYEVDARIAAAPAVTGLLNGHRRPQ